MSAPVRLGVVGTGAVSMRGLLPHLTMPDVAGRVQVEAVCDPAPGRVEAVRERFAIPRAFATLEEMLEGADLDAVTIATPIGLHFEQGKAALLAGKHVHFNKTMTTTADEASELIELARERNLRVVASPGEGLRPHVRRTRELIEEGAIGRVCWAICGKSFDRYHEDEHERIEALGAAPIDPSWYFRKPGGGPMYDMVVYDLHALTAVLGPAKRVSAMSGVRVHERSFQGAAMPTEADDLTVLTLDFGDSLLAVVHGTPTGRLAESPAIFGTSGAISGTLLNGEPFDFPERQRGDGAPDAWTAAGWMLPHVSGDHRGVREQHVFEDVMQLVDWIVDGTPSLATAEHARHVIEIIEAGYRAADTGQTQDLATTF